MEWETLIKHLKENSWAVTSLVIILVFILTAFLAPLLSPYDPLSINLDSLKLPPSGSHLFGTDSKGRDVLSRVIFGARYSLLIGFAVTFTSITFGIIVGALAGYFRGKTDIIITMLIDLVLAFPSLLLAIGISVALPPGIMSVFLALTLVGWAPFARLIRGIVLSLRESQFVDAAKVIGCSPLRILFLHIIPNCLPITIVAASLKIGSFILSESALSFLGLGIQPPTPTWGSMVSLNRTYLLSSPWMIIFPGLAIMVTVLVFNILGDFLRDYLDPHLRL
jgi:ABC-type dipeptide/oligopeptide/nickel transport system permease subunit